MKPKRSPMQQARFEFYGLGVMWLFASALLLFALATLLYTLALSVPHSLPMPPVHAGFVFCLGFVVHFGIRYAHRKGRPA